MNTQQLKEELQGWQEHYSDPADKNNYDFFTALIAAVDRLEAAERERDEFRELFNSNEGEKQTLFHQKDMLLTANLNIGKKLNQAERERDELRTEIEIERRDAAASDFIYQMRLLDGDENCSDWVEVTAIEYQTPTTDKYGTWERRILYTAAQPAVLPPEMLPENTLEIETLHGVKLSQMQRAIAADAYNQCRADALALGAQQQKVVELDNVFSVNVAGVAVRVVLLKDVSTSLDAANVKWEVKK